MVSAKILNPCGCEKKSQLTDLLSRIYHRTSLVSFLSSWLFLWELVAIWERERKVLKALKVVKILGHRTLLEIYRMAYMGVSSSLVGLCHWGLFSNCISSWFLTLPDNLLYCWEHVTGINKLTTVSDSSIRATERQLELRHASTALCFSDLTGKSTSWDHQSLFG